MVFPSFGLCMDTPQFRQTRPPQRPRLAFAGMMRSARSLNWTPGRQREFPTADWAGEVVPEMASKSISIFQIQVFSAQCTNLQCSCITYAYSIFRKGTGSCVFLRKRLLGFDTRAGPHWGGTRK